MEREAQALASRRRLAWIHTIEIVDKEHLEDYIHAVHLHKTESVSHLAPTGWPWRGETQALAARRRLAWTQIIEVVLIENT
jgi:hypothetical protein